MRREAVFYLSNLLKVNIRYIFDEELVEIMNKAKRFLDSNNILYLNEEFKGEFVLSYHYVGDNFSNALYNSKFKILVANLKKEAEYEGELSAFFNISLINSVINIKAFTPTNSSVFKKIGESIRGQRPIIRPKNEFFNNLREYNEFFLMRKEFTIDFINEPLAHFRWIVIMDSEIENTRFQDLKEISDRKPVFLVFGNHFHKISEFDRKYKVPSIFGGATEITLKYFAIAGKKSILMLYRDVAYHFLLPVSLMMLASMPS